MWISCRVDEGSNERISTLKTHEPLNDPAKGTTICNAVLRFI